MFTRKKKLLFKAGIKTIFEAGKAVILIDSVDKIHSITIQSTLQNTGIVFVGNSDVNSANGVALMNGEAITLDAHDRFLGNIYLTSNMSGAQIQFFSLGE